MLRWARHLLEALHVEVTLFPHFTLWFLLKSISDSRTANLSMYPSQFITGASFLKIWKSYPRFSTRFMPMFLDFCTIRRNFEINELV